MLLLNLGESNGNSRVQRKFEMSYELSAYGPAVCVVASNLGRKKYCAYPHIIGSLPAPTWCIDETYVHYFFSGNSTRTSFFDSSSVGLDGFILFKGCL